MIISRNRRTNVILLNTIEPNRIITKTNPVILRLTIMFMYRNINVLNKFYSEFIFFGSGFWVLGSGLWVLGSGLQRSVLTTYNQVHLFSIACIKRFSFFPRVSNRLCKLSYNFSFFNDSVSNKFSKWSMVSSLEAIE